MRFLSTAMSCDHRSGCWAVAGLQPNDVIHESSEHRGSSGDVASVPVLTRLCASPVAGEVAGTSLQSFRGNSPLGTMAGELACDASS